ncbi:MAG: hypothetical protein H6737_00070 [Alphaproteobacteria bacterium]|nr:hypothetical protein [Alphaproteobacteria bacterium]
MRKVCGIAVLVGVLACGGGFMEPVEYGGAEALARLGGIAGTPLPSGASDAHVIETTAIDWLLNGEASIPRAEADPWFDQLALPCDLPTGFTPETQPPVFKILGDATSWKIPDPGRWKTKYCESSNVNGPHYSVSITASGDPAWVWFHGMTL